MNSPPLKSFSPKADLPTSREAAIRWYIEFLGEAEKRGCANEAFRWLARNDLFYLLTRVLGRPDANRDWIFARCREVQNEPDGHLDLWAREHYKSTVITFALTIQEILKDPEITVGILSHTRPTAKGFLRQIKREFEANERLRAWFPDILWANPDRDAPKWSEDDGIIVRRTSNPKESTVEAWGLVDGQPTSKHFRLMVYDDVVTRESVTTPDMIKKVTEAWELSINLSTDGGRTRYVGTRYHYSDTYREIIARGAAIERIHPATVDGTADGEPVLLSRETLHKKRRDMGAYTFGSQMLLNPKSDETQGFKVDWLQRYENRSGAGMNTYILVDPASSKKKTSDYTAIFVIGLSTDENYYVLDIVRDRLSLTQRADALFELHRLWKPRGVGYEKYGLQADIEHIKDRQDRENYRFPITELGGAVAKTDRIRRLIPIMEAGRLYLPESLHKTDYQGHVVELTTAFIEEELKPFPVGLHDDMLDALSRILDEAMNLLWPKTVQATDRYASRARHRRRHGVSWQAA